jgi:TM2 domain-containing membrane protein YozV
MRETVEILSVKERDSYLCAAGSFFFPGLGQVYCGRILRGIVFLIPAVILTVPNFFMSLFYFGVDFPPFWLAGWTYLFTFLSKTVTFIVRVIATYDAYKVAESIKPLQSEHWI